MKKIIISLVALTALSATAFASSNRNYELRESDTYMGNSVQPDQGTAASVRAFKAAVFDGSALSLQQLIKRSQDERNVR